MASEDSNDLICSSIGIRITTSSSNCERKYLIRWPDGSLRWLFSITKRGPGFMVFQNNGILKSSLIFITSIVKCLFLSRLRLIEAPVSVKLKEDGLLKRAMGEVGADNWELFGGSPGVYRNVVVALLHKGEVISYLKIRLSRTSGELNSIGSDSFASERKAYEFFSSLRLENVVIPDCEGIGDGILLSPLRGEQVNLERSKNIFGDTLKEIYFNTSREISVSSYHQRKALDSRTSGLLNTTPKDNQFKKEDLDFIAKVLIDKTEALNEESKLHVCFALSDLTLWNSFVTEGKLGLIDLEFSERDVSLGYDAFHFLWQKEVMTKLDDDVEKLKVFRDTVLIPFVASLYNITDEASRLYFDFYLLKSTLARLELYVRQEALHAQALVQISVWKNLKALWASG